jgi:hypothetical protein
MEGQDGAVWDNLIFRFNHAAKCAVYDIDKMLLGDSTPIAYFDLDKKDLIMPHSNAVFFGNEFYAEGDEFPVLYSNVYNNYKNQPNKQKGVCCAYRLQRDGNSFTTTLLQVIEIDFVEDYNLWCSADMGDVRPYGNFVIDRQKSIYYAFTMIDDIYMARYFAFNLPKCRDGVDDEILGVKRLVLKAEDIIDQFDCEYHRFIQGVCCYNGKIYSLEGFGHDKENPPAIRVINPKTKTQEVFKTFKNPTEPELIDFWDGVCYYADNPGNMYILTEL